MNNKNSILDTSLQNNQLDAYKEMFFRYHGRLVLFANKFTGDLQVSQDLVQDAFLNFWKKSVSMSSIESPKAYLFQAVRNSCLNHSRHQNVKKSVDAQLAQQISELEKSLYLDHGDPLQSLLEMELEDKIEELIETMPEKCRNVYRMSRQKYIKNNEIAAELGISEKMVEKHISKALLILRSGLSGYLEVVLFILLNNFLFFV